MKGTTLCHQAWHKGPAGEQMLTDWWNFTGVFYSAVVKYGMLVWHWTTPFVTVICHASPPSHYNEQKSQVRKTLKPVTFFADLWSTLKMQLNQYIYKKIYIKAQGIQCRDPKLPSHSLQLGHGILLVVSTSFCKLNTCTHTWTRKVLHLHCLMFKHTLQYSGYNHTLLPIRSIHHFPEHFLMILPVTFSQISYAMFGVTVSDC